MIHVVAIITAKPGMRDAILAAFRANMPAVHAEKGCIEYGPAIDTEGMGGIQTRTTLTPSRFSMKNALPLYSLGTLPLG